MARQASLDISECPVARTLEAIGERWSLLIIRDAFDDIRRFNEFQKSLGLAKNILAARLKLLVEVGIFEMRPACDGSAYKEYVLTERGRSVFPIIVSMRQWGERHMFQVGETHSVLVDIEHGKPLLPLEVRSSNGHVVMSHDCQRRQVVKRK